MKAEKTKHQSEISYCMICGARFKRGEGWIDHHQMLCANRRYGWNFTVPEWPKGANSNGEIVADHK